MLSLPSHSQTLLIYNLLITQKGCNAVCMAYRQTREQALVS